MSDFSDDDEKLLGFLENPKLSDFDEAYELFGKMLEGMTEALNARVARRTWLDVKAEDVVNEALMKASVTIYLQLKGPRELLQEGDDGLPVDPDNLFKFERNHGLSLQSWVFQIIQGQGGGVLRTFNRRAVKHSEYHQDSIDTSVDHHPDTMASPIEDNLDCLRFGDRFDRLEEAIGTLPARQRFVLVTRFGIGIEGGFSIPVLKTLAQEFGLQGAHKIAARARKLDLENSVSKLQIQQIAQLLDIGTKQVSREISAAYAAVGAFLTQQDAA